MITKRIILATVIFSSVIVCSSCSDKEEDFVTIQKSSKETTFPVIIDENTNRKEITVDGKTYVFNIHHLQQETRAIGMDERIYPRDPNATLATVPVLASKGEYKKYESKYSPFADLSGVSIVLLRLNKFTFECKAPANIKQTSFDVTNITKEGFATESASRKGFTIDRILSTTSEVTLKCHFYIQDGIAYNIAGQQLTNSTYYPLPGDQVRYQFTYELRK